MVGWEKADMKEVGRGTVRVFFSLFGSRSVR